MEGNGKPVPVNTGTVLTVLEWPTGKAGTVVLEFDGVVLVAYAAQSYKDFKPGERIQARLKVHTSPFIDTSPVKRLHSFMQCYRMAWRREDEPNMARAGWNMTVPDIVGWGDAEGLSDFGGIVSINGIRFEVELEELILREFSRARRYAFRGGLHVVKVESLSAPS